VSSIPCAAIVSRAHGVDALDACTRDPVRSSVFDASKSTPSDPRTNDDELIALIEYGRR